MTHIRNRATAIAVTAVILTAAGAVAYAAIPDPSGRVNGCYTTNSSLLGPAKGSLRVVDTNESCRAGETPITWSQTGPTGPMGPVGATGATGPAGSVGPVVRLVRLVRLARWPDRRDRGDGTGRAGRTRRC